jgi:hypothetical protein
MHKYQDFINEIVSATKELEQELHNRQKGIQGDGTVEQLDLFLRELVLLKETISENKLPPKKKRWLQVTWFITDSWRGDSATGNRLLAIANKYQDNLD